MVDDRVSVTRVWHALALAWVVAALAACGGGGRDASGGSGGDGSFGRTAAPPQVSLSLRAPGLVLSEQELAVTVPFGSLPARRSVQVTLPPSVLDWGATSTTPRLQASASDPSPAGTGTVFLDFWPALPGTYTEAVQVFAEARTGDIGSFLDSKTITVTYTVTANDAVEVAFFPQGADLTWKQGTPEPEAAERTVLAKPGVIARQREIQYLTFPPAAASHPLVNGWWLDGPEFMPAAMVCADDEAGSSSCLPPGTYTARLRYEIVEDGRSSDVFWPVTLQVVP
ncbi:hypothetical protein GCM10028796_10060 [Ramlibacter monticola]|uniref:Uncharacterized protein n=1 Tax=Ramlibacter monticola TaxID=1926872 RepID=A0A936YXE8_9BURK|nr:hypothetical protein [Ramlibacter monticola]MBL0389861.1 hypothetical protein [Ramlibacter monticola]